MKEAKKVRHLSMIRIALMYIGVLLGAGFASGKEMWQFFGVFGGYGLIGIAFVTAIFVVLGCIVVEIAKTLGTNDMSRIVFPYTNRILENVIGAVIMLFLFSGYTSMIAAGGSLIEESFGIHRIAGTGFLMVLVLFTTLKGFSRLSASLGKVVPVLLISTLCMAAILLFRGIGHLTFARVETPSPLASSWPIAAAVFVAYNMMGAVPILGSCAIYAEKHTTAIKGAALGGLFLGGCAMALCLVTLTDPALSQNSALPMLAFSASLAPAVQKVYACVLLLAIFGTASSCFYGSSMKLSEGEKRVPALCILAVLGFGCSMFGFQNIVAFWYPVEGYICFIFIIMMVWNYMRIKGGKRK